MPTIKAESTITGNSHHWPQGMDRDLEASVLKYGSNSQASSKPITKERQLYSSDSVKNCLIKLLRYEPTTLRKPTSLARFADLAVARFTKLMQAMMRMNAATPPNNHINRISPCESPSSMS